MGNDGRMGGRVVVAVRQSAGDRHADGLISITYGWSDGLVGVSYRRWDSRAWSDGLVLMVDVWSDNVGQPDGHGRMVCRRSDGDGRSDRLVAKRMVCRQSDGGRRSD